MRAIALLGLVVALVLAFVGMSSIITLHGQVTTLTGGLGELWDDLPTLFVVIGVAVPMVALIVGSGFWLFHGR